MIRRYVFDYDTEILATGKKKRFPVIYKGQEKLIGGVGGGLVKTFIHFIQIKIGETKLEIPIAFVDSDETPRLLGRRDIFPNFYIGFNDSCYANNVFFVIPKRQRGIP